MAFKKNTNIDLTGKTAVVTGAGSGIGASTTRLLARVTTDVAADVLHAIARPRVVVVSPPSHVLGGYLLHRLSPRLA